MAGSAHKNYGSWFEEPELVCQMMCVHAGATANPAFSAFSVINEPADLLPTNGIHEIFVSHGSIYDPQH